MARRRATTTGVPGKRFSLAGGQSGIESEFSRDYTNNKIDTKSTAGDIAFVKSKSNQTTSPTLLFKSRTLVKPSGVLVNQNKKN